MRIHGWLKDSADPRDRSVGDLLKDKTFGDQASWEHCLPNVLDQKTTGSCVGQAGAGALETKHRIQGSKSPLSPSALFLYSIARLVEQRHHQDTGARIRNLLKGIVRYGICPEVDWPFKVAQVNTSPTWAAFRKAFDQRALQGYYRISSGGDQRIAEIKRALYEGHIPIFGMDVTSSFIDYSGGIIQSMTGPYEGGHAMFLYGYYHNEFFNGANSWGKSWGEAGRFRFSPRIIPLLRDIWVFQIAPEWSGT